ncbi:TetR/AcrR family transcriptional regulator [Streptomyces sp. NPDC048483]|uniref:TetR/AcrR family transcriptional regulator n=1 Tax=Streptomyces sp. NPDC048483 TaxID=3154927 RepID=UPI003438BE3A
MPTQPTQHRAIQSRQALIRSAAETFLEKGVPAAGMVEVSRRARLSKGALYFHFASKDDLTLAVHDGALATLQELESALARSPMPLVPAVRDFAVELFARVQSDPVLRAGLRLRPDTVPGLGVHALEHRWYPLFLDKALAGGAYGAAYGGDEADAAREADGEPQRTARLLTTVVAGLLHLGAEDRTWWGEEAIAGLWDGLPAAPGGGGTARDHVPAAGTAPAQPADATAHPDVTTHSGIGNRSDLTAEPARIRCDTPG